MSSAVTNAIPADILVRSKISWEINNNLPGIISRYPHFQDRTSNAIRDWYEDFKTDFIGHRNSEPAESIKQRNICLLKNKLKDPKEPFGPLDLNPQIGSDGYTYGEKWLLLFFRNVPIEHHFRSPFRMNEEPPPYFLTKPHPLAAKMIRWLTDQGEDISHPWDALYQQHRDSLPLLPTESTLITYMEEEVRRLAEEDDDEISEELEQFGQGLQEVGNSLLTTLDDRISTERQAFQQTANQLAAAVNTSEQQLLQNQGPEIQNTLNQTSARLTNLEARNEQSAQNLAQARTRINFAKGQTVKIKKGIDEENKAIKKRKKHKWKKYAGTGLWKAGSATLSYAFKAVVKVGGVAIDLTKKAATVTAHIGENRNNEDKDNKKGANP